MDQVKLAIRGALYPDIAKRAFELYEARGRIDGKDQEDWLEALRHADQVSIPVVHSV